MDDQQIVEQLLRLEPDRWATLPPPHALILADALTRRGDVGGAARLYRQVRKNAAPQSAWDEAARSGLGWIAFARGDLAGVRQHFAAGESDASRPLARVLVALLDAADRRPGAAAALERLGDDPVLHPQLREVARLGTGYAHFWAEDYGRATEALAKVGEGRLADDAAYGIGWARHVAGDDEGAQAALEPLASRRSGTSRGGVSHRLIRLEAPAVLRVGLRRYRELHIATDEAWLAEMLDGDGAKLARAALRLLARGKEAPVADGVGVGAPERMTALAARAQAEATPPASSVAQEARRATIRAAATLVALALAGLGAIALWRRRAPAPRR
jgi:hypothetical protein